MKKKTCSVLLHYDKLVIIHHEPFFDYFHLYIGATGCPSERRPQEEG